MIRNLLVVALPLLAGACQQILGVNDYHVASGATDAGHPSRLSTGGFDFDPPGHGNAACAACVTDQCSTQAQTCANEPTCQDFWSCRAKCAAGDDTCQNSCRTRSFPWGGGAYHVPPSGELEACVTAHCDAKCGERHVFGTAICAECARTKCSPDLDLGSYSASLPIQHLEACDAACLGVTLPPKTQISICPCDQAQDATPDALKAWFARRTCIETTCADDCGKPDLDCVGEAIWLVPAPVDINYRFAIFDPFLRAQVKGFTVSACNYGSITLDASIVSPQTRCPVITRADPFGVAAFKLLYNSTLGYASRFEVTLGDQVNLLYSTPTITQSITDWWGATTLAQTETLFGGPGDPAKGRLEVFTADCGGKPLAGVTVTIDHSTSATSYLSSTDGTGSVGVALFDGVEPNASIRVTATLKDGRFFGSRVVGVEANKLTFVGLPPTPLPP